MYVIRQLRVGLAVFVLFVFAIFIHAVNSYGHAQPSPSTSPVSYRSSHITAIQKPVSLTPALRPLTLQVGQGTSIIPIAVTTNDPKQPLHPRRNLMFMATLRPTDVELPNQNVSIAAKRVRKIKHQTQAIRVVKGDCLWSIANKYHTTITDLIAQNRLHTDVLQIGQRLQIPVRVHPQSAKSSHTTPPASNHHLTKQLLYVVHPGDTLWSLSTMYNLSVQQLKTANHLRSNQLRVGQHLFISLPTKLTDPAVRKLLHEAPARLLPVYQSAGSKYDIPWTVLAAIHKEETDFSTSGTSVSSAGAIGPMQFMPETFQRYGVPAPGHARPNIHNVNDAIYSAAHMLADEGFNRDPYRAIFAYNQSATYVRAILHLSAS